MSFEIAALIILLGSLVGMGVIVFRKLPVLAELPESFEGPGEGFWLRLKNKIASLPFVKNFSLTAFLQKALSRIRVLTLKTEHQTAQWLQALRQKSRQQNNFGKDNYWQEVKGATNDKKPKKPKVS